MRIIISIIWAVLISAVLSYVLSSMAGDPFDLTQTLFLSGILLIAVFTLGGAILTEESE